jgi:spore coat protein CotH
MSTNRPPEFCESSLGDRAGSHTRHKGKGEVMTPRSRSRLVVAGAIAVMASSTLFAQFPGGPGAAGGAALPFGPQQDLAVVEQFDADRNGWLNAEERRAAREFVTTQGGGRAGFAGRGFGRGGFGRGGGVAGGSPGPKVDAASVKPVADSVPLYDPLTVRTLFFEFENSDWEQELAAFKNTDVEVPATMTVDGRRYEKVGMSFRGNSSFMMVPEGLKRSFNVSVDLINEDQDVLGFRTLNLMNGVNDPTFMRGVLFADIAAAYVPTARANFVRVVVNGESWGIYTNLEQINRDFVEDRFNGENGVRWKVPGSPGSRAGLEYIGDDPEAYKRLFEIKNKDNPRSWEALVNLTKVLNTTPPDQLEAALSPILDIDGALKFLALDNVLVNSDGYWTRGSDYYLYLDEGGKFHVLPGDTNETFSSEGGRGGGPGGRGGRRGGPMPTPGGPTANGATAPPTDVVMGRGFGGGGGGPMMMGGGGPTLDLLVGLDDPTKPLRSKLLAVPALRDRYLAHCRDIAQTWLDWERLGTTARRYHDLIKAHVEADTRKMVTNEQFAASLDELRTFVEARRAYVLNYGKP